MLIEIKDNHIWHRNQLKSGVWGVKQKAAEKFADKNGILYILLFKENIEEFFKSIKI